MPREICGKSTFGLAVLLMKWLPLWLADKILLILAWLIFGNLEKYGLRRPFLGPLELKNISGKTPVLDIGALQKIRSGEIKVVPGIKRFSHGRVELVDGQNLEIDSVILATGYRSNVPSWLKVRIKFYYNISISMCLVWKLLFFNPCDSYGSFFSSSVSLPLPVLLLFFVSFFLQNLMSWLSHFFCNDFVFFITKIW